MNEPYAEITAVLPICLHLDERIFELETDGKTVEITTKNVTSDEPTWIGTATNMEVASDDFSHFRFSSVTVRMPYGEGAVDLKQMMEENYRSLFFGALNTFIAACRAALGRSGLRSYHDYGQFVRPVHATVVGAINPRNQRFVAFGLGGGPLTMFRPLRTDDEHTQLQGLLNTGIPLTKQFMLDARNYLYYHDPVHAILSAVIALEIAVSNTIRRMAAKKGIEPEAIKTFIHDVGLTGSIKTTLKLVVPAEVQLPDDAVFVGCKGAITVRNAIMHEGRRTVVLKEVGTWLGHIDVMVGFCDSLT